MVSSACVELPRGPFGLVFSLRNIKNITRQVGVSLKYSQYFQDLERVLIEFDKRIPLIKDAAQVKICVFSSLRQLSIELSTALVSSCATSTYASNVALHRHRCIIILNEFLTGEDRNCAT